jgi:hypothetical protein
MAGNAQVGETGTCVASCKELHHSQVDLQTCILKCPGIEEDKGYCEAADQPPEAVCVEDDPKLMIGALPKGVAASGGQGGAAP